jgi:hypothetical protein
MFIGHPLDALAVAHDRGRSFAPRLRPGAAARRSCAAWLAGWLRRAADLVDRKPRTLTPTLRGKR